MFLINLHISFGLLTSLEHSRVLSTTPTLIFYLYIYIQTKKLICFLSSNTNIDDTQNK